MAVTSIDQGVRRLAQYRPFERGGMDLRAVLRQLVVAAAAVNDGKMESTFECQDAFNACWNLEVEIDELRPVIDELAESGQVSRVGKGFVLSADLLTELSARAREWERTEERALREWEVDVRTMRPTLSNQEVDLLRTDLMDWLHQIISRHGAEAALMLYPEDKRARTFFEQVDARGMDRLPDRGPELGAVRKDALPLFIRTPTPDQRAFLAGLLNTSFYMTVLTIDPAAKELVQKQIKGSRLYLDTNFLYAVLGAAMPEEVYSARRLLKLSVELGFEVVVTPWTISELETSIASARRTIEANPQFIRPELAETMLRASGDKGFNRFFWQIYNEKRTQPKDVFDRLEHFHGDLTKYQIKEVSEGCTAIEQQDGRINDYASLLNSERWPYTKDQVVLEHDAKCRLLVERLRGDGRLRFSNARYWFLTYDTKLPRFAERVPDNGDPEPQMPFCISPSALVQVIRALTPRTEDFDRTVVDLLTSPFVGYQREIDPGVVREVVGRMDHLEDASPEMAIEVLTDTAEVSEIQRALKEKDEAALDKTIERAYSTKAKELEAAVATSQERAANAEEARLEAERRAEEAEAERNAHGEQVKVIRAEMADERAAMELERADLESKVQSADRGRDEAEAERDERINAIEQTLKNKEDEEARRHKRRWQIGAGTGLVLFGLIVAVTLPLLVVTSKGAVAGTIIGGAGFVLVGVRILVGKQWGGEVATWAALLASIAAIVISVALPT